MYAPLPISSGRYDTPQFTSWSARFRISPPGSYGHRPSPIGVPPHTLATPHPHSDSGAGLVARRQPPLLRLHTSVAVLPGWPSPTWLWLTLYCFAHNKTHLHSNPNPNLNGKTLHGARSVVKLVAGISLNSMYPCTRWRLYPRPRVGRAPTDMSVRVVREELYESGCMC